MGQGRKQIELKMKRRNAQAKKKARIKKKITAAKKQFFDFPLPNFFGRAMEIS